MKTVLNAAKRVWPVLALVGLIGGCAGGSTRPQPADLGPNTNLLGVRLAWSAQVGPVDFPLQVRVAAGRVTIAGSDGTVAAFDAKTGAPAWRSKVDAPISAGVGGDGTLSAVVTVENNLIVLDSMGVERWRHQLTAQGYTSPLVAGGRIFVLSADRSISAFDAGSGRKLWTQQRPGDALVLRQSGVLLAVGDTLVAGLSGRLLGLNPSNGSIRWDAPIASPRGTNEIERLVDLVGGVSRIGDVVCARAFQSKVGCVDAARGGVLWTQTASGSVGVDGDAKFVFGVEDNGRVQAWSRSNGEAAWQSERLQHRRLTAPLVVGRSLAVGDDTGWVHLLSREDGSPLARLPTDGKGVSAAPVLADGVMVVVSASGGVFGFKPE